MNLERQQVDPNQIQVPESVVNSIPLIFEDLWDRGDSVRKHSQDRRKIFEEFTNLLSERAQVEAEYSKNLMRICNNMKRLCQSKGDVGNMINLYSVELQQRAQQTNSLSENIKQYVVEYLRDILKEQDTNAKILFQESKRLEKELQNSIETLEKTRLRYLKSKRDFDDLQVQNQIYRVTSSTVQDKKDKHRLKVSQTEREVAEFKYVFQESLKDYNYCVEYFYPDQWKVMQAFQKQEEERNERIHDSILKMLMFETSFYKNIEFQIQLFAEVLHKLDLSVDMKKFIEQNKSNKPLYQQIQYEQFVSFIDCSMERIKENQQLKLDQQSELMIKKSVEEGQLIYECEASESNDKIKYVLDLVIKAWNDQIITTDQYDEFYHKTLEDIEYSKIFTFIMQIFRIQNKFTLNIQGFQALTCLFNCCLNACFKFRDSKYSRQLLVLSFTYFTLSKQEVQIPQVSQFMKKEDIDQYNKQIEQSQERTQSVNGSSASTQYNAIQSQVIKYRIVETDEAQNKENERDDNINKDQIQNQNSDSLKQQNEMSQSVVNSQERNPQDEEESKQNGQNENEQNQPNQNEEQQKKEYVTSKVYLYQQIMNHYLWKSRDFWESAIFDSAFEELKGCQELKKGENLKETQQRERNMCFGQLVSLLQNMLLFEIDIREIKFLLSKFAKLFYLTEDQLKTLNQTIDSHVQQNRQVNSINSL
ncbi:Fes/CIP4-like domain protein (macronuclear) [Tetrahymena thermophila SB210]|uniref:Fes/CIP4-like domain protein n=1 Tax=Tetrahymena thermophila (strain SB210) TaxID=312017 RepID=I7M4N2_TETTS|nr:Fes/CIP4-like domain protein [Tetrahymena thermophila SB210]EAS07717.2 Fes/CIP4-like domain protein [Tetrahymena thermophila SB210]|eukprot:XP_001027959.2 Fes/CIP4-like domain protein [Tetrahymena thermophila SB210]